MNKNLNYLILLILTGCAGLNQNSSQGNYLSNEDKQLLNSAIIFQNKIGSEIWPEYGSFQTALVYFPAKGQVLMGAGEAPNYYKKIAGQGPSFSPDIWYSPEIHTADGDLYPSSDFDRDYIASAYSSEQSNRHYPYSVFYVDSPDRFRFKKMDSSAEGWYIVFWHEVFHNFQDTLYPNGILDHVTDIGKIKELMADKKFDFLGLIKKEQLVLEKALLEKNPEKKRNVVCYEWLSLRQKRYSLMRSKYSNLNVKTEQFYEGSEGTARYVEVMMAIKASKLSLKELKEIVPEGTLSEFSYFAKVKERTMIDYYKHIYKMIEHKRYWYDTGLAMAFLLDQITPGWKADSFKSDGYQFDKISSFCKQK